MNRSKLKTTIQICASIGLVFSLSTITLAGDNVPDEVIEQQREELARNTDGQGYGPQAPRDIDDGNGANERLFSIAPDHTEMNLCNIHFHKNAEHKGGQFTKYAGNGDGHGYNTGYKYSGRLSRAEQDDSAGIVCEDSHGGVSAGDTIEVHYVHTTAKIKPGPTLGACLSEAIKNPELRVEAQVFVVVNDEDAGNFVELTKVDENNGYYQAPNIPEARKCKKGKKKCKKRRNRSVEYTGSTTGPSYNENGSPFQVTWNVRKKVRKVHISTVAEWCNGNIFDEDHAHGVRNLVINPDLLSKID